MFIVLQRSKEHNNAVINWLEVIVHFESIIDNPEATEMVGVNQNVNMCG